MAKRVLCALPNNSSIVRDKLFDTVASALFANVVYIIVITQGVHHLSIGAYPLYWFLGAREVKVHGWCCNV